MPSREKGFSLLEQLIMVAVPAILYVAVHPCNDALFISLNQLHSHVTDRSWLALTTLGDGLVLGIIVAGFLVVNPRIAAMGLAVMLLGSLTVNSVKWLCPTLRPAAVLESVHVVGPLLRSGSFPSGHTVSSLAAGLSIAYYFRFGKVGIAALSVAVLIGISRIFVGAHYPRDVIGGAIFAVGLFVLFTSLVWPRIEAKIPHRPDLTRRSYRAALSLEALVCVFVLVFYGPFLPNPLRSRLRPL